MSGYRGGPGYSDGFMSARRAARMVEYGEFETNKQTVLAILSRHAEDGATQREIRDLFDPGEQLSKHENTSGTLSVLNKEGRVRKLRDARSGQAIWVLPDFVGDREVIPYVPSGLHFDDEEKRVAGVLAARLDAAVRTTDQDVLLALLRKVARSG